MVLYSEKIFTTRSKRMRGEYPNRVPLRKMTGFQELSAICIRTLSDLTLEIAYTVSGLTALSSVNSPSASPYTEQDEENTKRMPARLAASARHIVVWKLTSSVNSGRSSAEGSFEIAARCRMQSHPS